MSCAPPAAPEWTHFDSPPRQERTRDALARTHARERVDHRVRDDMPLRDVPRGARARPWGRHGTVEAGALGEVLVGRGARRARLGASCAIAVVT